jgi:hypothetical protein
VLSAASAQVQGLFSTDDSITPEVLAAAREGDLTLLQIPLALPGDPSAADRAALEEAAAQGGPPVSFVSQAAPESQLVVELLVEQGRVVGVRTSAPAGDVKVAVYDCLTADVEPSSDNILTLPRAIDKLASRERRR